MHSKTRLLFAAVLALIALSAAATAANAASFSITPGGAITSISQGLLTFTAPSAGVKVTCRVTLRGTLTSGVLIPKTEGTKFGEITAGTTVESGGGRTCNSEGEGIPLFVTNWKLNYSSILGTLPENVTGILIKIVRAQFEVNIGVACLYEPELGILLEVERASPALYYSGLIRVLSGQRIPKKEGSVLCPAGELIGSFELRPHQTIKRL